MPPAGGRFAPQHMSNPFQHLNQQNHIQHGGHPGFGGAHANGNMGMFSPSTTSSGMGGGNFSNAGGQGLASYAAQQGFAHGAALQQHAQDQANQQPGAKGGMTTRIREVWRSNLAQEIDILRGLVDKYPYISMDTEFPGVVARPMGDFPTKASYHYQTVRCNVDLLKIISLGITLFTPEGELPPAQGEPHTQILSRAAYNGNMVMYPCSWSFNFRFSLEEDMYSEESIAVLQKAGADFQKFATQGIDPLEFGSLLITSGLALSDDVHWISFHSGYDFAYLVKIMWNQQLPADEEEYRLLVATFFPNIYDVKFLWKHANKLITRNGISASAAAALNNLGTKSGLQDLADELGCQRVGAQHTAGSDAWLTGNVFFAMRQKIFDNQIPDDMNGQMWGLTGVGAPASAAVQAAVLAAAQGHNPHQGVNGNNMGGALAMAYNSNTPGANPSTPTSNHANLASTTPGPSHGGTGSMTPGGGGFGNFQYQGR